MEAETRGSCTVGHRRRCEAGRQLAAAAIASFLQGGSTLGLRKVRTAKLFALALFLLLAAVPCIATGVPDPDLANEGMAKMLRQHLLANYSYQSPAPRAVARVQLFLSQLVAVDTCLLYTSPSPRD